MGNDVKSGYGPRPYDHLRARGQWASRFLDLVGDGTGSIEANLDASGTPIDFHYTVPEGKILLVDRLIVWIRDSGTFDANLYGNGLTLTNGIVAGITDPEGNFNLRTNQLPVRTNSDWPAYSFDFQYIDIGVGDNVAVAQYPYERDGASLVVRENHKYTLRIADNLTHLTGHRFRIGCVLCPDK